MVQVSRGNVSRRAVWRQCRDRQAGWEDVVAGVCLFQLAMSRCSDARGAKG